MQSVTSAVQEVVRHDGTSSASITPRKMSIRLPAMDCSVFDRRAWEAERRGRLGGLFAHVVEDTAVKIVVNLIKTGQHLANKPGKLSLGSQQSSSGRSPIGRSRSRFLIVSRGRLITIST